MTQTGAVLATAATDIKAWRSGGRRSRAARRRLVGALLGAVSLCASTPVLPAQAAATGYRIADLGTLGGSYSGPRAINRLGEVAGISKTEGGERHAFLYSRSMMRDLGTLGGPSSEAYGLNDGGEVVGESTTAAGDTHAFLFSGGVMRDLGTLGGTFSSAAAINAAGEIVGVSETESGDRHAFLYSEGVMRDLGTLGGGNSAAHGINDAGQIVGSSETAAGGFTTRAFLYSAGSMAPIEVGAAAPVDSAGAAEIADSGQVAGTMSVEGVNHAFRSDAGVTIDLGLLFSASFGQDLNNAGDVVGYSTNMEGGASHAFLYSGGALSDLAALVPTGSGWVGLRSAYAINDGGQIAGTGDQGGGVWHAFVMTPATAPDTMPPAPSSAFAVTAASMTSLDVSWSAARDDVALGGYNLYLDGTKVGSTASTSYTFPGLACGGRHELAVDSVDTSGNISVRVSLSASTAACPLAAVYRLDEGAGTTASDATGGGNAGSLQGGASWTGAGETGGALALDGASGYVDLPSLGTFYRQAFTLEAWAKPSTGRGDVALVGSWSWDRNGGPMLWVDGSGRFVLTLNHGSDNYLISDQSLRPGQWQHVAATYDGTTARLYLDGVQAASRPFSGNVGDSDSWRIGAYGASPTGFFDGSLDEVRIYGRALSAAEVAADMGPPPAAVDTSPPSAPTGLAVTRATETAITLAWSAAGDGGKTMSYAVFSDGTQVGTATGTSFTVSSLPCGTSRTLAVEALDQAGNRSPRTMLGASTAACPAPTPPAGPLAVYSLDDGSGTTASDATGGGHPGSLLGTAGWSTAGKAGGALSLDGTSGYVDLPSLGAFYQQGFTLEAWVKPSSAGGDVALVGSWRWDQGGGPMLWVDGSGRYVLTLNRGADNYLFSSQSVTAGQWQHVAATYDGTTARLYVDGVEVASRPFSGDAGASDSWRIGAYGASPTGFFDGLIDEVRIYGRPLSAAEISADMAAGSGAAEVSPPSPAIETTVAAPPATPVAAYSFDVLTDSTVTDSAGGHDATLAGGATWTGEGRVGGAISLGGGESGARVDLPSLGTFYKGGFTLAAWVKKADPAAGEMAIVGSWTTAGNGGPMLLIDDSGHLLLTLDARSADYVDSGYVVPAGEWHHLAASYDGATARTYVDGTLASSVSFGGSVGDSDTWRIGAYGATPIGYFGGLIDEVRIDARALSASEIASLAAPPAS